MILDSIATFLQSSGIGSIGLSIFLSYLPDTPQVSTGIYRTGGYFSPGDPVRYPTFQIVHRDSTSQQAITVSERIHFLLQNSWNQIPGTYGRFHAVHEPGNFYRDTNNQPVYVNNFIMKTTASTLV